MISRVISATPYGFNGQIIEVEGDMSKGLPSLQIVGMGNKAIDESRDRVRSAIKNSSLDFPKGKIIINLAPAELPKDGSLRSSYCPVYFMYQRCAQPKRYK